MVFTKKTDEESMNKFDTKRNDGLQLSIKQNGIDLDAIKPKMEDYASLVEFTKDFNKFRDWRKELIKDELVRFNELGGKKGLVVMDINKLNLYIDKKEQELVESGRNPIDDKNYMKALEQKNRLQNDMEKLDLDKTKAKGKWVIDRAKNPEVEKFINIDKTGDE